MNQGRTVFSQLISFLPDREFRRCVERYRGDLRWQQRRSRSVHWLPTNVLRTALD
jgi:hypothetical protein